MKNRFLFSSHFIFSLILSISLSLSLLPSTVLAFGFGEVKLFSYLDEPLDAEVELLGTENFDPTRILVTLASAQEFKKAGLARPFLLSNLQFQVERRGIHTVVKITSSEAIHQPYLEYLIDLSWPGGRLVRGYTLLLDPAPPGTLPLHERRPQVKNDHPAFNPNTVYTNNTTPGQGVTAQTGSSQVTSTSTGSNTNSNTHQERFERLFEEKTAEAMHQEAPPMTIVSTLSPSKQENMVASNQYSTQPQAAQAHVSEQAYQQGVQQQALQDPNYSSMNSNRSNDPRLTSAKDHGYPIQNSKDQVSLNKTQVLFAIASFSLLTLFIALFIIISRKNKKDFNLFNFFGRESADLTKNTSNLTNMPFPENDYGFLLEEASKNFSAASGTVSVSDISSDSAAAAAFAASLGAASLSTSAGGAFGTSAGSLGSVGDSFAGSTGPSAGSSGSEAASSSPSSGAPSSGGSSSNFPFNPSSYSVNYPAAQVAPVQNEMVMKLELARNYLGIDDQENGLRLLQDVLVRGSDWEKSQAQKLLHEFQDKHPQH